jgi:methionine-rich copper-binding protein CopC
MCRPEQHQGVRFVAYRSVKQIAASLLLGLLVSQAIAHTTVIDTSPRTGSILEQSPPSIEINFRDPVRLTSVVAVESGKPERKLEFTPADSAAKFKVTDPKLGPGRAEIRWKALSKDGHVISGSLILVIQPATAKTN